MALLGAGLASRRAGNRGRQYVRPDVHGQAATPGLSLSNGSGNVTIKAGKDGQVHVHGKVTPGSWSVFGSGEKSTQEIVANPPLEQRGDTILIGRNSSYIKNVSIEYDIEVPVGHGTGSRIGVRRNHG